MIPTEHYIQENDQFLHRPYAHLSTSQRESTKITNGLLIKYILQTNFFLEKLISVLFYKNLSRKLLV